MSVCLFIYFLRNFSVLKKLEIKLRTDESYAMFKLYMTSTFDSD